MSATVSERLVAFMRDCIGHGLPHEVLHETKRLVLNQLKASVGATNHPTVQRLHNWAIEGTTTAGEHAHILWLGGTARPAETAVVNGALFEVLDFHDTYIPTFMHAVSGVLPAVLAIAEARGKNGRDFLNALAIGIEVELACATILMPTGYYRGYVPAGLVGGVGSAAACSVLAGLDDERMCNALGIAMCTAFGTYESVGSDTLAYITGATSRSGLVAFELAERGFTAPRTAFEGEKGMFVTHSDESKDKIDGVLGSLGTDWRIFGQSYKTVPTETITHPPIELVLQLKRRANGRQVSKMRFGVEAIVVKIVNERMERFGNPGSDLQARFDLCYCAAAAWERGRFTLAEMQEPAYTDPKILALRSRIELVADPDRKTFEGAWLEIEFTDGTIDKANVDAFLGTPKNRMSDEQLASVFHHSAGELLSRERASAILDAVWRLEEEKDLRNFVALLTIHPAKSTIGLKSSLIRSLQLD